MYIVPMCCLNGTSNKEHTFKVMRGGRLFDGVRQMSQSPARSYTDHGWGMSRA